MRAARGAVRGRIRSLRHWIHRHGRKHRVPFSQGNALQLLSSGRELLEATLALIRSARGTLHFEMYIWRDDPVGREVLAALVEARDRGVEILGIVDHVGSWGAAGMIRAAGLGIRLYNPLGLNLPWRLWHLRNHRKLLIVDGREAVVGSANWGTEYVGGAGQEAYRDMGLRLMGPVVERLEEDFRRSWRKAGGGPVAERPKPGAPAVPEGWQDGVPVQLVSSLNRGGRVLRSQFRLVLRQLRARAVLANAYFVPGPAYLKGLVRSLRRGVALDLLVPGKSDHRIVQAASRATFGPLLAAGARIWEYGGEMLHTKAAVLDGRIAILGSANLDSRSLRHNLELNLVLDCPEVARQVETVLAEDMARSTPLDGRAWAQASWPHRILRRLAYAFWWWL